jgi:hypothetical protein
MTPFRLFHSDPEFPLRCEARIRLAEPRAIRLRPWFLFRVIGQPILIIYPAISLYKGSTSSLPVRRLRTRRHMLRKPFYKRFGKTVCHQAVRWIQCLT